MKLQRDAVRDELAKVCLVNKLELLPDNPDEGEFLHALSLAFQLHGRVTIDFRIGPPLKFRVAGEVEDYADPVATPLCEACPPDILRMMSDQIKELKALIIASQPRYERVAAQLTEAKRVSQLALLEALFTGRRPDTGGPSAG